MTKEILVVEDDAFQRQVVVNLLNRKLQYQTVEAACGKDALGIVKDKGADAILLVVLDLMLPDMHGLEVLELLKERYPALPVVVLTGSDDAQDAVRATKLGAVDFMRKPVELDRLSVSIQNALKLNALSKEVQRLRRQDEAETVFADLIGAEGGLAEVVSVGRKAAASEIPVMITGETGVGKELFSRAVHGESNRAGQPFVAVNCGAIPDNLVESTLFGHEKGSFTGATHKAMGKFREEEGGTIFLDEVGELPLETQVKLLRVLQQKEVEPVGAGKPVPINVRVISATNRNLQDEVTEGRFREDLFFRLEGSPIHVPALRDRKQDIGDLADYMLEHFASSEDLPVKHLDEVAIKRLMAHSWPGNVRELRNILHRAIVLADSEIIGAEELAIIMRGGAHTMKAEQPAVGGYHIAVVQDSGEMTQMEHIERRAMEIAMEYHQGNIAQAAKGLGIAKSTFYRKWSAFEEATKESA